MPRSRAHVDRDTHPGLGGSDEFALHWWLVEKGQEQKKKVSLMVRRTAVRRASKRTRAKWRLTGSGGEAEPSFLGRWSLVLESGKWGEGPVRHGPLANTWLSVWWVPPGRARPEGGAISLPMVTAGRLGLLLVRLCVSVVCFHLLRFSVSATTEGLSTELSVLCVSEEENKPKTARVSCR
jgi:hypothetical protein